MVRKPRIAILGDFPLGMISNQYPARTKFYPTWLFNLFESLSDVENFDVHWIVADKMIKTEETLHVRNQTFHLIPASRLKLGLYTAYLYNRYKVAKCVSKIKPDIFHGWGTERFYGLCARDFKGKSILSVQGLLMVCCQRARLSPFEEKQKWYEPGVLRSVKHITTESPWARERVRELAPSADITLCEYAVEKCFFEVKRHLSEIPSCLMACSHTPVKNVSMALSAFSRAELRHIKLYLAGVSPEAFHSLPENIIPLGGVNREKLVELMSHSWCFIHTSLADTGPTAVKEARVAGMPVILTTECGSKQYVEDGKSGFVISPQDENTLVDAVLKVTTSREMASRMGEEGKAACRAKLSVEAMSKTFINLYTRILND